MRLDNLFLRLLSLAGKFLLALYMGRYLSLSAIGVYGLVFSAVQILGVLLGQELNFVVCREIVPLDPKACLIRMRDQAALYGVNYLALVVAMTICVMLRSTEISPKILYYTTTLAILESFCTVTQFNLNARQKQLAASWLFVVRTSAWVLPVVAIGILNPSLRTMDSILIGWIIGGIVCLAGTIWVWRDLPWSSVVSLPIDWRWIRSCIKKTHLVWLGMISLTVGGFGERFVVEHVLTIEDVGIVTFYFSFTNALLVFAQSAVLVFSTPRLITYHAEADSKSFRQEALYAVTHTAFGCALLAACIGIGVTGLAYLLGRHAILVAIGTFWLMLGGAWLRVNAEALKSVIYARHQDRAIWLGDLLFVVPAVGFNLIFVPWFGLPGVGYSAIAASFLLLIWRYMHLSDILRIPVDRDR